jgi:hypothetical protein
VTATITVIERATVARINEEHRLCERAAADAVAHAVECGRLLAEVKGQLRHGEFTPWLEQHFDASVRTAQTYMQLAAAPEQDAQRVAGMSLRQARDSIARPKPARADRAEVDAALAAEFGGEVSPETTAALEGAITRMHESEQRYLAPSEGAAEQRRIRKAREHWTEIGQHLDTLEREELSRWAKREEAQAAGVVTRRLIVALDDLARDLER